MASSLVKTRLWTLLAGASVTAAGLWGAHAWDQRARAQAEQTSEAQRIFRCTPDIVGLRLSPTGAPNAAGTIALSRRPAPASPNDANAPKQVAGGGAPSPWLLELPVRAPADASTTDALLEAACSLRRQSRIEAKAGEPPLALASFGLEPPKRLLTLVQEDGSEQTLAIGERSTFNDALYVQREGGGPIGAAPTVDVVDGGFAFQVERDAFSLREKRLLTLLSGAVSAVDVHVAAGRSFRVARDGNGHWSLPAAGAADGADANAPATRADDQAVGTWLDGLLHVRAKQFVDEAPDAARLAHFGLAKPAYEIVLAGEGNRPPERLRLGALAIAGEPHVFAQAGTAGAVVAEIEGPSLTDKLADGGDHLRDMRLLHVDPAAVERLIVSEGNRTLALVRPEGDAHGWRLEGESGGAVDAGKVDGLIYRLAHLRADTLANEAASAEELAAAGLASPSVSVELQGAQARCLGHLRAGVAAAERRSAIGDDGRLAQIFAQAIDGVSTDPNEFFGR